MDTLDAFLNLKVKQKKLCAALLLTAAAKRTKTAKENDDPTTAADNEDQESAEETWPSHAQLRGSNLKTQNVLLRQLCRDAIKIVHTTLVTTHAWPELRATHLSEYRRDVLLKAAKVLQKKEEKYADIRARLKKDEKFTMVLGRLVCVVSFFKSILTCFTYRSLIA